LGRALGILALSAAVCGTVQARQLEQPKPIRITHVRGRVVNIHGAPVVNAEVTLTENDKPVLSTHTDANGAFGFERMRGHYWLRVARTEFAPALQELEVTDEIVTALERKRLYIIVGPGACADACSQVFTNKGEFEKALKRMPKGPVR
jgi:hypothetical protein